MIIVWRMMKKTIRMLLIYFDESLPADTEYVFNRTEIPDRPRH